MLFIFFLRSDLILYFNPDRPWCCTPDPVKQGTLILSGVKQSVSHYNHPFPSPSPHPHPPPVSPQLLRRFHDRVCVCVCVCLCVFSWWQCLFRFSRLLYWHLSDLRLHCQIPSVFNVLMCIMKSSTWQNALIGWQGHCPPPHQVLSSWRWLTSLLGSLTLPSESLKTTHEISASGKANSK